MRIHIKPRRFLLCIGACIFAASTSAARAEDVEVALRPAVRVLLEDLHNQSRISDNGNFGQPCVKRVLTEEGAVVDCTMNELKAGNDGQRRLTMAFLRKYDLVISHGRYNGTAPCGAAPGSVLKNYKTPQIVEVFADDEIKALRDYIAEGGFVLAISGGGTLGYGCGLPLYNPLLRPFGVEVDNVKSEGLGAPSLPRDREHPLLHDIDALFPVFPTTLTVTNPAAIHLAFLKDKPLLTTVPHGLGWLIVLGGGSGWMNQGMDNPKLQERAGQNRQLLRNLVGWVSVAGSINKPSRKG